MKGKGLRETKTAIVRGEGQIIGAGILTHKKKTFLEAVMWGMERWKRGG